MTITLFTAPSCVQCTATKKALDGKGLDYDTVDVSQDSEALERVRAMGYRQAPVVIAGEEHWCGFRPDLIQKLA